jgi:hypothetical protein
VALAVVRPRADGPGQVARSRNEFVGNDGVYEFDANIAVTRGDQVGIVAVPGSGVGARTRVSGARTQRWIPLLNGTKAPDFGAGTGFDDEILLRVEYLPGGHQLIPDQVTGAAAERLDPGQVRARRKVRFPNGRLAEIVIAHVGNRLVLDEFLEGKRTARIDLPGYSPAVGGNFITFQVSDEGTPLSLGIYMEYVNQESARVIQHYYSVVPNEFEFVN